MGKQRGDQASSDDRWRAGHQPGFAVSVSRTASELVHAGQDARPSRRGDMGGEESSCLRVSPQ